MGNKGLSEERIDEHESYGMVGWNRVSSTGTNLFGSTVPHRTFVKMTIKPAKMRRSLAYDRPSADSRSLIEAYIGLDDLAGLTTGLGIGDGVCCTIRAFNGKMMEACPAPKSIESKYAEDLKATTEETVAGLKQLMQQLSQSLLPGEKTLNKTELKALLSQIQSVLSSITDSMPFIEKSFHEEMEMQLNIQRGMLKADAAQIIHNVGLKALAAAEVPQLAQPEQAQLAEGKEE